MDAPAAPADAPDDAPAAMASILDSAGAHTDAERTLRWAAAKSSSVTVMSMASCAGDALAETRTLAALRGPLPWRAVAARVHVDVAARRHRPADLRGNEQSGNWRPPSRAAPRAACPIRLFPPPLGPSPPMPVPPSVPTPHRVLSVRAQLF